MLPPFPAPPQGGMEDKRVPSSGPMSVILKGEGEESLHQQHTAASAARWTIPVTGPGSPARDRALAHPQPLKS